MISTLRDQLHFVRAVQRVNTHGVEPLRAIQDETDVARRENTITLSHMKGLLDAEERVGHYKRAKRVRQRIEDERSEKWQVLATAGRTAGKYFVVESKKTSA
jgi:Asp-tRNA(Asn)/Glu-tRNA(Gln) amidotransferase C subunit